MAYGRWPKYVSVATRKAKAQKKIAALKKKGMSMLPVDIQGRAIARSFWGQAWCEHLEKFSDYKNRLPRGRTYVRNGSVCHLQISKGRIDAMVAGNHIYDISIKIDMLPKRQWKEIQKQCAGSISSVVELLQGKLSDSVMRTVTDQRTGLFPKPSEIHLNCNCPDWADLCKHLAAVLYGVGTRLDENPSLLFTLRGVDQRELVTDEVHVDTGEASSNVRGDLVDIFGIDLDDGPVSEMSAVVKVPARGKTKKKSTAISNVIPKAKAKAKAKAKSKAKSKIYSKVNAKAKSKVSSRVTPSAKLKAKAKAKSRARPKAKGS